MSRIKDQFMEDESNGYVSGKKLNVCHKHFGDKDIVNFIKNKGNPMLTCSFCKHDDFDEINEEVNSISWDYLLHRIVPCINKFYDDPANGLSYESSEGGYLGRTYNTLELLQDEIRIDADDDIIEEIANSMNQDIWTEADFYRGTYTDNLVYNWNVFSKLVKYEVRYFFNEIEAKSDSYGYSNKPFLILKEIGEFISELNLIITVPEKSNFFNQEIYFYRARQHNKGITISTVSEIGSAPNKFAGANRFSAEGISMFYGAEDEETAIKEIVNYDKKDDIITIGKFFPTKELNFIDLRNIPSIGFFNAEKIHLLEPSNFLKEFVKRICQKIEDKENERIKYVPSQIVTEYFRHVLPYSLKKEIHGIIYNSVQNNGKDCYAIFADRSKCNDENKQSDDTLLVLKTNSMNEISVKDLK